MEYYSTIKRMDLEGSLLSEISQTKKDTARSHLFVEFIKQNKQTNTTK